ncbi:hypothetical protein [Bowdeniella massiliensis]|uniref:hypothetical protein n=1 Tax=Bowdeniella massiliensis TaxID=2932264 RepID=UPI002029851B|nr:hypothetical protein [Bowdeniella massiliensis]
MDLHPALETLRQLRQATERYEKRLDAIKAERDRNIIAARDAGITWFDISNATGLSRQHLTAIYRNTKQEGEA